MFETILAQPDCGTFSPLSITVPTLSSFAPRSSCMKNILRKKRKCVRKRKKTPRRERVRYGLRKVLLYSRGCNFVTIIREEMGVTAIER